MTNNDIPPELSKGTIRQRLLYLHASGTSVLSSVIAADRREPTRVPQPPRLSPQPQLPYQTIHEAIVDGWRVIQFPNQAVPIDDRELNVAGYEFILEKLEPFDD